VRPLCSGETRTDPQKESLVRADFDGHFSKSPIRVSNYID
jgi:hypothetical protein